ncbi:hypothetical protein DL96DRAFT_1666755 [Flagelloscypha sp. PMI_526]|nr:hypothetical protein DL96DRAFT_1666755 [Flagelloscypha sp. PMI_526]
MTEAQSSTGGGSLLIAWQLKNKNVVIVGGGVVASQRIDSLLVTDARLTRSKLLLEKHPNRIAYIDREYDGSSDLSGADMVLTALDDVQVSRTIVAQCRSAKIPVNAADIPDACDFYFGAQIRDGPLQIMISTNGNGPRLAALVKERLQGALSGKEGEALEKVGELRNLLKERAPGVGGSVGKRRMKWMTKLCNEWNMDDFAQLNVAMMNRILDLGWDNDVVPSIQDVGGSPSRHKPLLPH